MEVGARDLKAAILIGVNLESAYTSPCIEGISHSTDDKFGVGIEVVLY